MKKTIKILIPALALLLGAVSPSRAFTNLGILNLGDPVYTGGAKSLSLGLTSVSSAKNASCVFSNAAAMSAFEGSRFSFSLPLVFVSERVIPDSNWSADEGGAYYNSNFSFEVPETAFVYAFSEKVKLGMGMTQRMSFRYKHEENAYSGGSYIGKFDYSGTGSISAWDIAASFKISETWAYGITQEIISGSPSIETNIIGATPALTTNEKREYDFSGSRTNFSLYRDRGLWNYGISYAAPAGLDYDLKYSSTGVPSIKYKGEIELPRTLTLGVNHIWAGAVSASIYFDIVKTFWSDMSFVDPVTLAKQNYKDIVSYHLGVENDLSSTLQIRYGMAFIPSYERSSVERAYITGGFGYYVTSNMYVDLGYAYGRRNYLESWDRFSGSYGG
ncbi:MAG: outer membrane protein transport protein, partial [Elusimicrobia bacterium]|nr:outer membrane protein transport protein [Elusimicrobiota bacterium]